MSLSSRSWREKTTRGYRLSSGESIRSSLQLALICGVAFTNYFMILLVDQERLREQSKYCWWDHCDVVAGGWDIVASCRKQTLERLTWDNLRARVLDT